MGNTEGNLEIDVMDILEKMKTRVAEDAQKIAMLEATIDIYVSKIIEMNKQIQMFNEIQSQ